MLREQSKQIHWIVIYPVDSVIQLSNDRDQVYIDDDQFLTHFHSIRLIESESEQPALSFFSTQSC